MEFLDYKDSDLWKELDKKAEMLVKERIKGHRKGLPDDPNYLHSFRVRDSVMRNHHWDDPDYDLFLAALLHDIVEDGETSLEELTKLGFPDLTVRYVDLATHQMEIKNKTERWVLMIGRILKADEKEVWRIKLADLADNLTQSIGLSPENRNFMLTVKSPLMLRLTENEVMLQPHRHELEVELEKQLML